MNGSSQFNPFNPVLGEYCV